MTTPKAQTKWESEWVAHILKAHRPQLYVEIGSHTGKSLRFMRENFPNVEMIAIDDGQKQAALTQTAAEVDAELIIHDSHSEPAHRKLKGSLDGREIDLLFIDGDHSCVGCALDVEMYTPFVRRGGIVMFHDCGEPWANIGVKRGSIPWMGEKQDKTNIPINLKTIMNVRGVYLAYAQGRKHLLIQEEVGIGLVWK